MKIKKKILAHDFDRVDRTRPSFALALAAAQQPSKESSAHSSALDDTIWLYCGQSGHCTSLRYYGPGDACIKCGRPLSFTHPAHVAKAPLPRDPKPRP